MIYDGVHGYLSGDLSQPDGTVLAMTLGPIKGRNWYGPNDPIYQIIMSANATGTVALEGTNDLTIADASGLELNPIEKVQQPPEGAVWTPIEAATASTVIGGSFSVEYEFLRLILVASGVGYCITAWVCWN